MCLATNFLKLVVYPRLRLALIGDAPIGVKYRVCVRSRWLTSPKCTVASRNPDVSNWMLEAMPSVGHAKCVRSRWPTSPKWTVASRGPDISNWMLGAMPSVGHAKCVRSRWPTSPKWTVASTGPDVSNWKLVCEVKMADITEMGADFHGL
ncbi:hypothetical protein EMCRGX_G024303 [Ephydatia muelleri]